MIYIDTHLLVHTYTYLGMYTYVCMAVNRLQVLTVVSILVWRCFWVKVTLYSSICLKVDIFDFYSVPLLVHEKCLTHCHCFITRPTVPDAIRATCLFLFYFINFFYSEGRSDITWNEFPFYAESSMKCIIMLLFLFPLAVWSMLVPVRSAMLIVIFSKLEEEQTTSQFEISI